MNLSDLRPTQPTELRLLSEYLRGCSAKAAVPSALPEHFLISVARDLRMLEEDKDGEHEPSYLAAPMMLIFCLQLGRGKDDEQFTISKSDLFRSLQVYQWEVEREIVRRLVGAGGLINDDSTLLERLEAACTASE